MFTLLLTSLWTFQWNSADELSRAINHANELFRSQHYQEALQEYLDLYQKNPDNDLLAYNLANAYQVLGMGEKAQELYQAAAKSKGSARGSGKGGEKPGDLALYNSGSAHLEESRFVDAVTNLVDYLKRHPEDMDAKRNLELALQRMEQQSQEQQSERQNQQEEQNQQNQEGESSQEQESEQPAGEGEQQQDQAPENGEPAEGEDQGEPSANRTGEDRPEEGEQPKQGEQGQEQETDWNEQMKQQILQALADQEQKTQAEHRSRKSGPVSRRARDW
jgi:flagellar biosynthesis GTPase FlhF